MPLSSSSLFSHQTPRIMGKCKIHSPPLQILFIKFLHLRMEHTNCSSGGICICVKFNSTNMNGVTVVEHTTHHPTHHRVSPSGGLIVVNSFLANTLGQCLCHLLSLSAAGFNFKLFGFVRVVCCDCSEIIHTHLLEFEC
jgi:hypothetical protein